MRSLGLKLLGAFALVILLGGAVDALLVSRATRGQFNRFVTASGQSWAEQLAPVLAKHYTRMGDWQGVDAVLNFPWQGMMGMAQTGAGSQNRSWMESGMMGSRMMDGPMGSAGMDRTWSDMSSSMMDEDMWGWMGLRLVLADAQGRVVADTGSTLTGTSLSTAEMAAGIPVEALGARVGVLLPVTAITDDPSPAGEFLRAVNRSTWLASLAATSLALLLGLLLTHQIVAPLRKLTTAARQIAAGHLEQRVPVTSQDEVGQLGVTFNDMADALTRDQRLRRDMMADIAHELRTPLSVMQGNLEAMLDGVLPAEPQEIALLHDETMLLKRLVADLRLLSLAEAGQLKLERAPANLAELINRAVEHLRLQAEANQVALVVDMPPDLPLVEVDTDRMEQVLGNLLSNALRYTPAQGRITVRAHVQPTTDQTKSIEVAVSDTGKGIPASDLPHVFDRFYRSDKSRTRASGGTGIGLALVKQLVEAHGGRVWVESEVEKGATFTLALPVMAPLPQDRL